MAETKLPAERRFSGPTAFVAPVDEDSDEVNTIALYPLSLEFLAIRVLFHQVPVGDLQVRITTIDGTEVAAGLRTDAQGRVLLAQRVPPGTYICELEHQPPVHVSTVAKIDESFPIPLPIGRPYTDLYERCEILDAPTSGTSPPKSR